MNLHEKQQFDFLLMTAAERFSERLIQRNAGAENALKKLRHDPQSEGVWLDDFVKVLFQDFLLDNTAGACFILEALEKRGDERRQSRRGFAGVVAKSFRRLAQTKTRRDA
jgi:hypothetical protein